MSHRAPETEVVERNSLRSRVFQEKYLPHIAMAAVAIFYVLFYMITGLASQNFTGAAMPQTISLAFTATTATWFGYCIRDRSKGEK